jgi:hypothetical protein
MVVILSWQSVANLGTTGPSAAAVDNQGRIYALGGDGPTGTLQRFDPNTGQWTTLTSMPTARRLAGAATDSLGRIYAIAGQRQFEATGVVERYDPATGQWTTLPSIVARNGVAVASDLVGRIYAFGGFTSPSTFNTAQRFDPGTSEWTTLANLPVALSGHCGASDNLGRIYSIGGTDTAGTARAFYRYDPATGLWTDLGDLPSDRNNAAAVSDAQGRIYVLGGSSSGKLVDRYDPATSTWESASPMAFNHSTFGAARGLDGRLYAIGGSSSNVAERASFNAPPDAPTLTTMAAGGTVDRAAVNRASHTFSDPNPGDSQSAFDLRYRLVGAPTWTTVAAPTPNPFYDFAAGTFAAGDYERQVRTYDSLGVVGPWSASGFFSAADVPDGPSITYPVNGQFVELEETLTWSTADQDAYQVRRVADDAGEPDPGVVYFDTGEVASTTARSLPLTFTVNDRIEHVQLRVKNDGLFSPWTSVSVEVSFAPPPTPLLAFEAEPDTASLVLTITNPEPAGDEPAAAYNDVYIDDGNGEERKATLLPTNTTWRYWTPRSGRDYAGSVRVEAVATNGTTAST